MKLGFTQGLPDLTWLTGDPGLGPPFPGPHPAPSGTMGAPGPQRPSPGSILGSVLRLTPHSFLPSRTIGDRMGRPRPVGTWAARLRCWAALMRAVVCCQRHLDIAQEQGDKVGRQHWLGAPAGTGPQRIPPRAPGAGWEETGDGPCSETRALLARVGRGAESWAPRFPVCSPLTRPPAESSDSPHRSWARGAAGVEVALGGSLGRRLC